MKVCSGCNRAVYCGAECQNKAWANHQATCTAVAVMTRLGPFLKGLAARSTNAKRREEGESRLASLDEVASPYPDGTISEELQTAVKTIRKALRHYSAQANLWVPDGADDDLVEAIAHLIRECAKLSVREIDGF